MAHHFVTRPTPTCVLIVDRSDAWGPDLRARLAPLGVHVHVVGSRAAALTFAVTKKIDVAVLEYAIDNWTKELGAAFKTLNIPCVYTTAPNDVDSLVLGGSGIDLGSYESAVI